VVAFLHRRGRQLADVGTAFLLSHELAALRQLAHIGLRETIEVFRLQRIAAKIREQLGAAIGDVDRAAETELGLVEQEGEGVLCDHRIFIRPAQNALTQRHRVNAEFAERSPLQLAIGRMILDPLRVAAETIALVQYRHVAVGQPRAFVEMTAGEPAEPVEMRLDMAEQRIRQMNAQQVGQRRIGAVKIHPRRIRRQQTRLIGRCRHVVMFAQLVHWQPLSFRP
jgi:hypothetical protein